MKGEVKEFHTRVPMSMVVPHAEIEIQKGNLARTIDFIISGASQKICLAYLEFGAGQRFVRPKLP